MKALLTGVAFCAALFVVTASAQRGPAAPEGQVPPRNPAPAAPGEQIPALKTFEGQLSKVDATMKTIIVKGAQEKEMTFAYNDQTQIVGSENTPQGLTGKTGADLKVTYREDRGSNLASRIEFVEKK